MAVSIDLQLPEQPVIGSVVYNPLAGDGWTAPHSVSEFSVGSAGSASGGNNVITITFDPRFTSILTYVRATNSSASTAIEMSIVLLPALPRSTPQVEAFCNTVPIKALGTQNVMTWAPPPLPHLGRLQVVEANVNGDELDAMGYLYQFQRDVLHQVPLNLILASLPRGDSVYPVTAA